MLLADGRKIPSHADYDRKILLFISIFLSLSFCLYNQSMCERPFLVLSCVRRSKIAERREDERSFRDECNKRGPHNGADVRIQHTKHRAVNSRAQKKGSFTDVERE